uniref:Uncharacterized protein n=1 Tax=Oryza meridionalis TaxID=40149 RepID=A0A0E0EWI3_9ORYZ
RQCASSSRCSESRESGVPLPLAGSSPLGLVWLGRSRPVSGPNPRGSPRRGNNPGPCEIVCSVKPSQGFTPAFPPHPYPGKNQLLVWRGKNPHDRSREATRSGSTTRRRFEVALRRGRRDAEATATARRSPPAAIFSLFSDGVI